MACEWLMEMNHRMDTLINDTTKLRIQHTKKSHTQVYVSISKLFAN